MPCFNEAATLDEALARVFDSGLPLEVIAVDDGSRDASREILARWRRLRQTDDARLHVLTHERNQGKGAALKTGFLAATGDVVVVQDADLEYDPLDFWRLARPIVLDQADVVFGSRFLAAANGSPHDAPPRDHADEQSAAAIPRPAMPYRWQSLGNRFITRVSNHFTGLGLTDIETGYKAFRREVIARIAPTLVEKRFGVEPELVAKVARLPGVRVLETPITYTGRTYAEGKKIGWRDGARALYAAARHGGRR